MLSSKTKLPPLEDRFAFLGDAIAVGDRQALRSSLYEVDDRSTGQELTLKLWRKSGGEGDADLRELWRHEMRQVSRLAAYAEARDVIVSVLEFVEDEDHFGLVLDRIGHPLSEKRKRVPRDHWLRLLSAARPRSLFRRNIARVVTALGLIHRQGLVHGAVNADAIMTEGAEQPDFQLGGFEWSLSLADEAAGGSHAKVSRTAAILRPSSYSFAEDWRCLGGLIVECLVADRAGTGILTTTAHQAMANAILTTGERQLLKRLLTPSRSDQLDAQSIGRAIGDLLVGLARTGATKAGSLILAIEPRAGLAACVYDATDGAIPVDEFQRQLEWLRADLDGGATLLTPRPFDAERHILKLVTEHLVCDLRPARLEGAAIWDVAICHHIAQRQQALPFRGEQDHEIAQPILVARGSRDAERLKAQLGPDVLDWSAFGTASARPIRNDDVATVRDGLFVAQLVEAVVKASEAFPIEILHRGREDGRPVVALRALPGSERDKLARKLRLAEGDAALKRLFEEDGRDPEVRWRLSRSAAMRASRAFDVGVSFIDVTEVKGKVAYRFELDEDLGDEPKALYLRPLSDSGSEQAITRRLGILQSLESRTDLAQMLVDPWRLRRSSRETLSIEDRASEGFLELDRPKQETLVAAFETAPNFLVVGPPGVGKTRLATEVVTRKFAMDGSSRILISAQGHDALGHLQEKVQKALVDAKLDKVLVVRSTTPERRTSRPEEVQLRALQLLDNLNRSPGLGDLQVQIRERVRDLRLSVEQHLHHQKPLASQDRAGLGALTHLLLDAADVVFSTLNSPDVERLVEARDQFDWLIIEESARATGPELIGAMMLSARRLLIGDHRQLPAFDADRMLAILADHSLVVAALKQAQDWLRPILGDEEQERLGALLKGEPEILRATAERAHRLFAPFRALVEEDERLAGSRTGHRRIAATLTEQRRMDPAIAEIVSEAFYEGKLTTSQSRIDELANGMPFAHLPPLTAAPVLVIDFPHVSAPVAGEPVARDQSRRGWRNPAEVDAVIGVLRQVRAVEGKRPTLAVLSPYKAQVEALQRKISTAMSGELRHLAAFSSVRSDGGFVGTVDSFQGSEADLVILSLVRNNPLVGVKAVGFLRDQRRMNVALSRAKAQLVVVGSLRFLREAVRGVNPDGGAHDLGFLTTVVDVINRLEKTSRGAQSLAKKIAPSAVMAVSR